LHRQPVVEQQAEAAERADQRAGDRIAGDAAEVVGEVDGPGGSRTPGSAGHLQAQRGDDAAAHPGAMHAAEQADQEYREETAVRHCG
jgi:hypothetical protein